MRVLVEPIEDAVLRTLSESGLVLDAVQLAERLSAMPSEVELAAAKLVAAGDLHEKNSLFGTTYFIAR